MTAAQEVEKLYADFLEQFREQNAARAPGQGVFGMGPGPADLPCHRQLLENIEALAADFAARGLSSGELRGALEVIYREPVELQSRAAAAYWTLLAAQGASLGLIDGLDAADAAALYARYNRAYPRIKRLPVQKKIFAALGKARAQGNFS